MGLGLVNDLDGLLSQHHVKSDEHTIIAWEIDILKAKAKVLVEGGELLETLRDSMLISERGTIISETPPFLERVKSFISLTES